MPEAPDFRLPQTDVWRNLLARFLASPTGEQIVRCVHEDIDAGKQIYPPQVFRAFDLTPAESVKVVILGQDPYHGFGQAEGLAFSVPNGVKVPPSLRNIKKELLRDLQMPITPNGSLIPWAQQGVLLLNAILTVEADAAASHRGLGWQQLTDEVIETLSTQTDHVVFMLWGNFAQSKRPLIDEGKHLVLCANHPSPLSASRPPVPFIGCGHFSAANAWLTARGKTPINWQI
ncbi:MAG: uracil-DNA glycosylase [Sutterella wadsworthensis]|nr:uracil-DNA glycosylase [Sutterella wadsworthensis]